MGHRVEPLLSDIDRLAAQKGGRQAPRRWRKLMASSVAHRFRASVSMGEGSVSVSAAHIAGRRGSTAC